MSDIKKKPVIAKIIFGRTGVIVLLLIVQIAILFLGFLHFYGFMQYIIGGFTILSAIMVIYIINKNDNPAFKLAWMLPVLVAPVLGIFFYLFVQTNLGTMKMRRRIFDILQTTKGYLKTDMHVENELAVKEPNLKTLAAYVQNTAGFPIYKNTEIKYFPSGEYKLQEMINQLQKAEKFIFLEYFIIAEGEMWGNILDILERKVKEGVEVRVMFDGMGTLMTLPGGYDKVLRQKGIKAKIFSPVRPMLSTHQDNRDHRKILVIDGKVAFNGGINLADEYINKKMVYGHWKDVAVMLTGDAVRSFTFMFLQMWNVTEKQPDDYFRYFQNTESVEAQGYIMPYGDNPLMEDRIGETVYLDILYKAKKYVHIMTPYLILDNETVTALSVAAKSGIDVKIIVPHIPDKKIPFAIARSFYPVLINAGIRVYEYTPGFVHAKMFISDDEKAVVGTINLDYRSLYHHFECATYMESVAEIQHMENDFEETLEMCQLVTHESYKSIKAIDRLLGKVFRLFAPLM